MTMAGVIRGFHKARPWNDFSGAVQITDPILASTATSNAATPTTVDLSANGRTYNSSEIHLYNMDTTNSVEFALGGPVLGTCSGPLVELNVGTTYRAPVNEGFNFDALLIGRPYEIYDDSSSNALLYSFWVKSFSQGDLYVIIERIAGSGTVADGDDFGGPNRYTFTAGAGAVVFPASFETLHPDYPYHYLHMRAVAGTPLVRVIQVR